MQVQNKGGMILPASNQIYPVSDEVGDQTSNSL